MARFEDVLYQTGFNPHSDQVVQSWFVKAELPDTAAHHWPVCSTRPARSALPSPVKSPTRTSAQLRLGESATQVVHRVWVKDMPVEVATHHCPVAGSRPARSSLPSPLKSASCTSAHASGPHTSQSRSVKPVPVEVPTHQTPVCGSRPTRSARPSP